jgi:hypothetical protein
LRKCAKYEISSHHQNYHNSHFEFSIPLIIISFDIKDTESATTSKLFSLSSNILAARAGDIFTNSKQISLNIGISAVTENDYIIIKYGGKIYTREKTLPAKKRFRVL